MHIYLATLEYSLTDTSSDTYPAVPFVIMEERQAYLLRIRAAAWMYVFREAVDATKDVKDSKDKDEIKKATKSDKWWETKFLAREKLVTCILKIINHPFDDNRLSLTHPEFKDLGGPYTSIDDQWTLEYVVEELRIIIVHLLDSLSTHPNTTDPTKPKHYTDYLLNMMPTVAIPVGHLIGLENLEADKTIVYARLDKNQNAHFVN